MRRSIIDYGKMTPEIFKVLQKKYPDGYGDKDIVYFKNAKNTLIEALEVKTKEIIYLIKVCPLLEQKLNMSN
ncbi:hypothetical protein [Aureivirga marina]|uniref:hypothetical protein n=1 Tax=Aureivirga marina TaxID=1182451 RepID=UPI0018CAC03D|nr:hypothetical protein [Aureivirga marina]